MSIYVCKQAKGVYGIYPANSVGDDIEVYEDETRSTARCVLYGLRQQAEKDSEVCVCL